ncbi:hypothetical protein QBC32DRAFT_337112 [Pseudoneurospora amorphoporcata]|uniref:Uncharacterized protein n=1 Tax=Pseudoneurospora amorphoporcata TaxID=241081 RepID=A0AAN6P251_9PEZI|nr:hypothetical protein QBC32DRAFT_337112 [Pseudoneurospora amorphoporcata]
MDTEDAGESQAALLELRTKKGYIFGCVTRSITMGKESPVRVNNGLDNGIGDHVRDNGSAGIVTATPDCHAQDGRQGHIARTSGVGQVSGGHDDLLKDVSYMPSDTKEQR